MKRAPSAVIPEIDGQKFYELTAVSRVEGKWWMFRCSCGQRRKLDAKRVMNGDVKTCGDRKMHHPITKQAKNPEMDLEQD